MTDTVPLLFDVAGERDAPAVVLAHGFPLTRAVWGQVAMPLAERYRVFTPDLRGHGATPARDEPTSMDAMARDVLALMDAQGVERFAFVGHSMAGYVALALARLAPERLSALGLVSTRASPDSDAAKQNRRKQADLVHLEGVGALVNLLLPKLLAPSTGGVVREEARRIMEANSVTGIVHALEAMAERPDAMPHLKGIQVPTLVIAGAEDQVMPRAEQDTLAREIPGARMEVVEKAGHLPMLEVPQAVADVLKSFLDESLNTST